MNSLREKILSDFLISPRELNRIISTAPHRYKVFYIPKKRPDQFREIAQPAKELKALQSWLVSYLIDHLPIHDCAVAYRPGRGIKYNALQHTGKKFVLKMDLEGFFPSIIQNDIESHLAKYCPNQHTKSEVEDICRLILWNNNSRHQLCIGAPSSPFISNTILYDLDQVIYLYCNNLGVTYTRYADDLIFSTNNEKLLWQIEHFIYKALRELSYPRLVVNKKKTIHTSKGRGILITGIVVTPSGALSLGRERKRLIRASIHHFINQKLSYKEIEQLNGWLAFSQDIEPNFIDNMKLKYGKDVLLKIRQYLSLMTDEL